MARKVAVLPIVGMVMAECAQAGRMILGKAAMSNGMSSFVFVLYSNAIACLILLPSSFLFHRFSSLSLSTHAVKESCTSDITLLFFSFIWQIIREASTHPVNCLWILLAWSFWVCTSL
jgi:hypothetical protein